MKWRKGKTKKNQRHRRRNVLSVKASVAVIRRARLRALLYTTTSSLIVLFAIYVFFRAGDWLLNALVYDNRAYAIQRLEVDTDGVMSTEQIRRWAGIKQGDNLFALDLARVKRDLELQPAIQDVAIERILPHTLRIHVLEREPVAQILTTTLRNGELAQTVAYLLDAQGNVMLPLDPSQRAVPLMAGERYPVITGANLADLTPGKQVDSAQIRAAMRLITAFEHSPMAGLVELKRIDVSSRDVLQVTTDQHATVCVRTDDLDRQLRRWRLIYDTGLLQRRQIGSLDLSVEENIPLRWLDVDDYPPLTFKPKKRSPYHKKHV